MPLLYDKNGNLEPGCMRAEWVEAGIEDGHRHPDAITGPKRLTSGSREALEAMVVVREQALKRTDRNIEEAQQRGVRPQARELRVLQKRKSRLEQGIKDLKRSLQ